MARVRRQKGIERLEQLELLEPFGTKVQRLMPRDDQERWDRQYAVAPGPDGPSSFLAEIFQPKRGPYRRVERSISRAARDGTHCSSRPEVLTLLLWIFRSVALAEARRRALARSLAVSWQQADLEQIHLPQAKYDLIINFNYLQRSLIPQIHSALTVGGHVIFETYLIDQKEIGHPKNPAIPTCP